MTTANATILDRYRQPVWGGVDRALRNCLVGSAIVCAVALIAIFVAPAPPVETHRVEELPDRIARLILEKPAPVTPATPAPPVNVAEAPKVETPPAPPKARTPPRHRTETPRVAPDKGVQGRAKAQKEVTQNLAEVTGSLDKVLDNLSTALPASDKPTGGDAPGGRRRPRVRSGRSTQQLASVGGISDLSVPDVSGSAIESNGISIASIIDLAGETGGSGDAPGSPGTAAGGGELRTSAELLAAVRRYAPGIQFCYDNELKKNPGLRGKLVVSITVLASGRVSDVVIVEDTLDSSAVSSCVVSQIRGWQLPAIPSGVMSFKAPFVFTPPR